LHARTLLLDAAKAPFAPKERRVYKSCVEKKSSTTRAIAVQLPAHTIKKLDVLAQQSGMTRHRYMILVLERAIEKELTLRETVQFSVEL